MAYVTYHESNTETFHFDKKSKEATQKLARQILISFAITTSVTVATVFTLYFLMSSLNG